MAVAAVLLYHGDVSWARGGYLGVDAFFVLSGFLITSLLLAEWRGDGRIALSAFWARRARRLLPALFLVLAAVAAYGAAIAAPAELAHLRSEGLSALGYVANWGQIFSHQSYFESFAAPSPLRHMWSLAIEEQFYLAWPLIVGLVGMVVLRHARRPGRARRIFRRLLVGVCVTLGAASFARMVTLYASSRDFNRVYYGTDTRAFILLAGAALCWQASGWDGSGSTRPRRPAGSTAAASHCARCSSRS